jgi:hypothetical protein
MQISPMRLFGTHLNEIVFPGNPALAGLRAKLYRDATCRIIDQRGIKRLGYESLLRLKRYLRLSPCR